MTQQPVWRNIGLALLSLALAFLLWMVATEAENPTEDRQLNTAIPVEIQGLPETMIAYNLSESSVRVTLKAPQSVWRELTASDVRAYLDLSRVVTGTNTLPVQVQARGNPVNLVTVTPHEIAVNVEPLTDKEVPVDVVVQGAPASGYRHDAPVIAPRRVRVRGPASQVAQVDRALITVELQREQSDVSNDYPPRPVDAAGNPVRNVEVSPDAVTVSIAIWQLSYIRDLAVTVSLDGQPAPGYRIANLEVDPPVLKVFGRTEIVRAAPGFLQTQPISLTGRTESLTTTVALQMPEGLSTFPPARPEVTVTLTIEAIRSGMTLNVEPRIRGLEPGLSATVGIDSVVVIMSGPIAIMETLDPDDVQLTLDLTELEAGSYAILPDIIVPDNVTIENIIPEAVPVQIAEPAEADADTDTEP